MELNVMLDLAKGMITGKYRKIRRLALTDDYLSECFNEGFNTKEIGLCEYIRSEIKKHGRIINFPYDLQK